MNSMMNNFINTATPQLEDPQDDIDLMIEESTMRFLDNDNQCNSNREMEQKTTESVVTEQ